MTTKAEKRVAIAKDVLRQLAAKKYRATPGTYCQLREHDAKKLDRCSNDQLQGALPQLRSCAVCALGAAFMSAVAKFDNLSICGANLGLAEGDFYVRTSPNRGLIFSHLEKFFSRRQIAEIECHFEGWAKQYDSMDPDSAFMAGSDRAVAFKRKWRSPGRRLAAIMRNIVRNEGTFVP
jgi:hypothetical protein